MRLPRDDDPLWFLRDASLREKAKKKLECANRGLGKVGVSRRIFSFKPVASSSTSLPVALLLETSIHIPQKSETRLLERCTDDKNVRSWTSASRNGMGRQVS